jgi:hypothetical protein
MRSGEWLSPDFQTSAGELVQATSDLAAVVEQSELEASCSPFRSG